MYRVKSSRNAAIDKFGPGKNGFKAGDPQLAIPATTPGYEWFDMIQEEIAKVVEANGMTVDENSMDQLYTAIQKMVKPASDELAEHIVAEDPHPVYSNALNTHIQNPEAHPQYALKNSSLLISSSVPPTNQGNIVYVLNNGLMYWHDELSKYFTIESIVKNRINIEWLSATQIKANIGTVRDSTSRYDIFLGAPIVATLNSPTNNTWYHVFICTNGADNQIIFDVSINPTLQSSYAVYARIGSVKTDATGKILKFLQIDKTVFWDTPIKDVYLNGYAAIVAVNGKNLAVSTPPDVIVKADFHVYVYADNARIFLRPPSQGAFAITPFQDVTPNAFNGGFGIATGSPLDLFSTSIKTFTENGQTCFNYAGVNHAQTGAYFNLVTIGYTEI